MTDLEISRIAAPFVQDCELLAREAYATHGRDPEAILVKERRLAELKADLTLTRSSIAVLEAQIPTLRGAALVEAMSKIFTLQGKRSELEDRVWQKQLTLGFLKAPSFA